MTFTGMEIGALRKAAQAVTHSLLTGPGPGAGTVDKPLRTSRIPGLERRKAYLDAEDAVLFARELLGRAAKSETLDTPPTDTEIEAVAQAVGAAMFSLPNARIDLPLALEADLDPVRIAEWLRAGSPDVAALVGADAEPLFTIVLDLTSAHAVEFFTRRDRFVAAALTHLVARDGRALKPAEVHATLQDYARLVRKKCDNMPLFGLDLSDGDRAIDLLTGFVDLTIEEAAAAVDQRRSPDAHRISWEQIDNLVEDRRRVLLEGPAGSGKSTLLRRLTLNALSEPPTGKPRLLITKGPDTRAPIPRLPFLIRLRDHVENNRLTLPPPARFLEALTPELTGRLPGWEHSLLSKGHAILLVDGLDELPEQLRRPALDWLTGIVTVYGEARYIVTSRAAAVDDGLRSSLRDLGFTSATISTMSPGQVETFVDRWHEAARLRNPGEGADLDASAASLKQALRSRRDLARIATTPLLCAMICALYHSDNRTLPQNRTALYERAFAMLFEKRDTQQDIRTLPVRLSREQVEPFLSEFALWMLLERRRSIPKKIARSKVSAVLPTLQIKNAPDGWKPTPDDMLRYLLERSGVLQDPTMDLLEFRHPSFQDYLAAKRVFQEEHLQLLIDNAHDPLYQDVAVMAAGQAQNDRERQNRLLGGLLERATKERRYSRQLRLLALACIADVGVVERKWVTRIRARTKSLLPPRTTAEAQALAAAGDFVLDLLADVTRTHRFTSAEAAATIEAVMMIDVDDPTTVGIVGALTKDPDIDVRTSLMVALNASDRPDFYARHVLANVDFAGARFQVDDGSLVPKLVNLRNLERLHLNGYSESIDFKDLSAFPHLHHLHIAPFPRLALSDLKLSHLVRLSLNSIQASQLREIPDITELELANVDRMPSGAALGNLRLLRLGPNVDWPSSFLGELPVLRDLILHSTWTEILVGDSLPVLEGLERLEISGPYPLDRIRFARLPRLTDLTLDGFGEPELRVVNENELSHLTLTSCENVHYPKLLTLPDTIELTVEASSPRSLPVETLARVGRLTGVSLRQERGLDLSPLRRLSNVSRLILRRASDDVISQLEALPQITDLTLESVVGVDLVKLAAIPHLASLTIHRVGSMDLAPLRAHPRLEVTVTDPTASWSA